MVPLNMIPHSRPGFGPACFDAVRRVLLSRQVTAANEVICLESEVAKRLLQPHAVAVDSGTSALMLAIRALKGAGDKKFMVGIPAYTCSSVLHGVLGAGATPVCMDCGPDLRLHRDKSLTMAKRLDAVVIVHPFGYADPSVSDDWPCPVIEDIAQSAGGTLHGRVLGSFGDISVVSFYATKPWGGAYGGMILSRDEQLIERIRHMRRADDSDNYPDDDACNIYAGNHQLSDIHAVLIRMRLKQGDQERRNRNRIAAMFDDWFAHSTHQPVALAAGDGYYRYIVRHTAAAETTVRHFRTNHVYACRPVQQTSSSLLGDATCPGAESAYNDCVSIPLLADFSPKEIKQIQGIIKLLHESIHGRTGAEG